MWHLARFAASLTLLAALAAMPSAAQQTGSSVISIRPTPRVQAAPTTAAKPYEPVAVKLPEAADDASLERFRGEVAAVAKRRIYGELTRLVTMQGFFWDRDFNGGFDAKQAGVDNLAAAVRLERRNGMGWGTLAALAMATTTTPLVGRLGIICAPGEPTFDGVEFDRLTDATRSSARDWAYPRADKTPVRTAPQAGAAVIDTLGLVFVHVLGYEAKEQEPDTLRAAWAKVATPAGKIGFVAPGALMSLAPARLCYGKDGFGRWQIAGFISGE